MMAGPISAPVFQYQDKGQDFLILGHISDRAKITNNNLEKIYVQDRSAAHGSIQSLTPTIQLTGDMSYTTIPASGLHTLSLSGGYSPSDREAPHMEKDISGQVVPVLVVGRDNKDKL